MNLLEKIIASSAKNSDSEIFKNRFNTLDNNEEVELFRLQCYTYFNEESESEKKALVSHHDLFSAENFKYLTGIDLPDDISKWFSEYPVFTTLQYPVFYRYNSDNWSGSYVQLLHPQRMALTILNKWNKEHKRYNADTPYKFKVKKEIPVGYIGNGIYLTYYYGGEKSNGYYYEDVKIADSYEELIKRLCINPDYYKEIEWRQEKSGEYAGFTEKSAIPEHLFT